MFILRRRRRQAEQARGGKRPVFLTAEWRRLAMLNYEVDPGALGAYVPAGTELDDWEGRHYVSVVGLVFVDTRVWGVRVPFHGDFEEINLRFYVRREVEGEVRRGVVFVKEVVPKRAIAVVARVAYNENYVAMPVRHWARCDGDGGGYEVGYRWGKAAGEHGLSVRVEGEPGELVDGSEEEFITEHYWGYAAQRDGGTLEYEVEHPRWRVWRAREATLRCDAERLYGGEFADALGGEPASAFLAEGSPVVVRKGVRI